jgi:multiple sugar transport system substrate-binding protein
MIVRNPYNPLRFSRRSVLRGLGGGAAALAAGRLGSPSRHAVAQGGSCGDDANKLVWMVRTVPVENEWEYDVVSPAFAAQHPDICLEILSLTQDDVTIKRPAMLAAGEKLHVWSAAWGNEGNATLLNEGWLEDLTPIMQADGFDTSVFVPGALAFDNVGGKQYGLPLTSTGTYVYYNKKIFDDAGVPYPPSEWDDPTWTWDRFAEIAKSLTRDYDDPSKAQYGAVASVVNADPTNPARLWGLDIWPAGAYETGFADGITIANDRGIAAFQAFHDAIHKDQFAPDPAVVDALSQLGGAFASGKVGMVIDGGWGVWIYKGLLDDPNGFPWGMAPLPLGAPDATTRADTYIDSWSMTSGMSDHDKELAWTLIKFLVSEEQARGYMEKTGTPPTQGKLLLDYYKLYEKAMEPDAMKAVFEGGLSHGSPGSGYKLIGWGQLFQIWANMLPAYFADPGADTQAMLTDLETQTSAKLKEIKQQFGA